MMLRAYLDASLKLDSSSLRIPTQASACKARVGLATGTFDLHEDGNRARVAGCLRQRKRLLWCPTQRAACFLTGCEPFLFEQVHV